MYGVSAKQLSMMDVRFKKNYTPPPGGFNVENLIDMLTEPLADTVHMRSQVACDMLTRAYALAVDNCIVIIKSYPDEMKHLCSRGYKTPTKMLLHAAREYPTSVHKPLIDALMKLHTCLRLYRETSRAVETEFEY